MRPDASKKLRAAAPKQGPNPVIIGAVIAAVVIVGVVVAIVIGSNSKSSGAPGGSAQPKGDACADALRLGRAPRSAAGLAVASDHDGHHHPHDHDGRDDRTDDDRVGSLLGRGCLELLRGVWTHLGDLSFYPNKR